MSSLAFLKPVAPPAATLESVAKEWLAAKALEAAAIEKRRAVEERLLPLVQAQEEGTVTEKLEGLKVSVTYKIDRKVDAEAVQNAWNTLPPIVQDAFSWKPELVLKQARALEAANPEAYKTLAQFITAKPAKPSVKVEALEAK
jgi:hypothetical protein